MQRKNMARKEGCNNSYFSHDSNARNSDKLIKLRMRHKAAGYGVYFMILERLREEPEYMSVKDYNMIAFDLREDASLIKSVVEDFGLFVFTEDGKYFYSESFKRRMEIKDEKIKKRVEAGKKGLEKRWGNGKSVANATENDSNAIANATENDSKKRKEKKSKESLSSERDKKSAPEGASRSPDHPGFHSEKVEKPLDECKAFVLDDLEWVEVVRMQQYIDQTDFNSYLDEFFRDLACRNVRMKSPEDAKSHFASWLSIKLEKLRRNAGNKKNNTSTVPKQYGEY